MTTIAAFLAALALTVIASLSLAACSIPPRFHSTGCMYVFWPEDVGWTCPIGHNRGTP